MSDEVFRVLCPCGKPVAVGTYAGSLCAECAAKLPKHCDFCDFAAPEWRYPCTSFIEGVYRKDNLNLVAAQEGDWGACLTCHVLIQHEQWSALADRAMSGQPPINDPVERLLARLHLLNLYSKFRQHRTGAPHRADTWEQTT